MTVENFLQLIRGFFANVGLTDVIDVLATSVLIYYVLLLIIGTRAVQILIGVLVLVGMLGIANLLHLYLLGSILQVMVVGAAVTLPIVFQPELRRALEQIGRGGLFRMGSEQIDRFRADDPSVTILAHTAFALSQNRTGALIVLEQQTGLREFVESGTVLNAQLSVELLLTIFMARSPLHDGAVIVRDDVVEGAGCFLPIADLRTATEHRDGQLIEKRMGTRHRAALGVTEQTDAVVIIVSEESGAVTIARGGKLSRPIEDAARLERMLLAITRVPRAQRIARMQNMLPKMQNSITGDWAEHLRDRLFAGRNREGKESVRE